MKNIQDKTTSQLEKRGEKLYCILQDEVGSATMDFINEYVEVERELTLREGQ